MMSVISPLPGSIGDQQKEASNHLVISFLSLRNLIGSSGMLLPVVLTLLTPRAQQDKVMEHSISEYYYTSNGDLLVVLLSVIGVFLLTYKGYNEFWERVLTLLAAVGAIGVAFFPTATKIGNSLSIHKVKTQVPLVFGLQWHFSLPVFSFSPWPFFRCIIFQRPMTAPPCEQPRENGQGKQSET